MDVCLKWDCALCNISITLGALRIPYEQRILTYLYVNIDRLSCLSGIRFAFDLTGSQQPAYCNELFKDNK